MTTLTPPTDSATWTLPGGRVMTLINGKWKYLPDGPNGTGAVGIPVEFGVPYKSNEFYGDRPIWKVRIDCGFLPNNNAKVISIPTNVLSTMDVSVSEFNPHIDTTSSYATTSTAGQIVPIPYVSSGSSAACVDVWYIYLTGTISLRTGADRRGWRGMVTIKYLRNDE